MTSKNLDHSLKEYSLEELADSFVFPTPLNKQEKLLDDQTLKRVLTKKRKEMSPKDVLKVKLLQVRFEIEDYLADNTCEASMSFGYFLRRYVKILNKKNVDFANEIKLKPSELSQYLNDHRKPPKNVLIRLELHSEKIISAVEWYRLIEKENIQELKTNTALRKQERHNVKTIAAAV